MTRADIIKHYGGINKAAEQLGYSRNAIWKWRKGVPLRTQIFIEATTNGALKAQTRSK
jgi:hypothetical protein